jgi:predicted Fe-S protein YdhL (DUF1289 family)
MRIKRGIETVEYICKSLNVMDFDTVCEGCFSMGRWAQGPDGVKYCLNCGRDADELEIVRNNCHEYDHENTNK